MSTSTTATTSATLGTNALPRPGYLQGKGYHNKKDRIAISALRIYENGRLSNRPCQLCVNNNKDCVVDHHKSSRCAWCSYKSMKNRECCAEGVKPFTTLQGPTNPHGNNTAPLSVPVTNTAPPHVPVTHAAPQTIQVTNTASPHVPVTHATAPTIQVTNAAPELSMNTRPATADFKEAMTRPKGVNVHGSVFPNRASSIVGSTNPYSDATEDTNQKRKHHTSDPADAETMKKRTRLILTDHAHAATTPGSEVVGSFFTPIYVTTMQDTPPTVTEHPYAPTAPKPEAIAHVSAPTTSALATAENTATEHPYAPTAPKPEPIITPTSEPTTPEQPHSTLIEYSHNSVGPGIASSAFASVAVPIMMEDLSKSRLAPVGSIECDLAIRTQDPVKWAEWAEDLQKEIGRLRHVQDLGAHTMNIVAMMIEDGVWPRYTSIIPEEE